MTLNIYYYIRYFSPPQRNKRKKLKRKQALHESLTQYPLNDTTKLTTTHSTTGVQYLAADPGETQCLCRSNMVRGSGIIYIIFISYVIRSVTITLVNLSF